MSESRVNMNLESFIESQLSLLQIEYAAEIKKANKLHQKNLQLVELERQKVEINKLRCVSICPGLFRYLMVSLGHNQPDHPLPPHKITVGDVVSLHEGPDVESLASGVVYSLNSKEITVAIKKDIDLDQEFTEKINYRLIKSPNDVTYRRLKNALIDLKNYPKGGRAQRLIDLLFGKRSPGHPADIDSIEFFNKQLDDSQKEAITFALRSQDLCIIHGPPGTGKTTSLVEIILQLAKRGLKILVCTPSNVAVDNLVERLSAYKVQNMTRLGHPARTSKDLLKFTLDAAIARSDENSTRKRNKRAQIQHEKQIVEQVLIRSDIVLSTLISASRYGPLEHIVENSCKQFDVLIIDECSQALEIACWIPLTFVDKCILAGDHFQLPPTIISAIAAKKGLELTLMERLLSSFDHELVVRMLTVQYRMHQDIMEWSSNRFYSNKLVAHDSVQNQSISEISNLQDCPPLLLIDTAGCDMSELDVKDGESKGNESEADIAAYYVLHLIKAGVKPENIGIITPYNLQVELIQMRLNQKYPTIEIRSVDGFQGQEKEVIILSLVRSNDRKKTGFLSEHRRLNVAVTRAKKHLVVICDSNTVSSEPHISSLITYLNDRGKVKSAREYLSSIKIFKDIKRPQHLRLKELKKDKKTTKKTSERKANNNKKITSVPDNQKPKAKPTVSQDSRPQDNNDTVREIRQKLVEFQSSSEVKLAFPLTLSSFKRRKVYEIAEELNLIHFKVTREGGKRQILVKKKIPKKSPTKSLIAERSDQKNPQQSDEICLAKELDTKVNQSSNNLDEQQSKKISKKPANPEKSTEPKTVKEQTVAEHVTDVQKKDQPVVLTKNFDLNSKLDELEDEMSDLVKKINNVNFATNDFV